MVSRMAGGMEKITVAKIADTEPMPKKGMAGIRYTKAGMVCMKSSTGMTMRYRRFDRAAMMPMGRAITTATAVAMTTSVSVCTMGSHKPMLSMSSRPTTDPSISRQPDRRRQIRATTAMNTQSGVPSSTSLRLSMPSCVMREIPRVTTEYSVVSHFRPASIQGPMGTLGSTPSIIALLPPQPPVPAPHPE